MVTSSHLRTVAVVIPTIGRSTLVRSVESVLDQSLPAAQVIVAVDGAQHEGAVRSCLAGVESAVLEIVVVDPPARCPAGPRNAALERVSCDLVAFLDDDDAWVPDKLAAQVPCFEPGVVAVASNATILGIGEPHPYFVEPAQVVGVRDRLLVNPIITSSMVCRTEVIRECGGFPLDPPLLDDYAAWMRVATQGAIRIVDQELVRYAGVVGESVSTRIKRATADPVGDVIRATLRWARASGQPGDITRQLLIGRLVHPLRRAREFGLIVWNKVRRR